MPRPVRISRARWRGPGARRPLALASLCTAALAAIGCLAATVRPRRQSRNRPRGAVLPAAAGAKPGDAVICDIDMGSELELAGYRPLLDTRAELSAPSSTAERRLGAGAVRSYRRRGSHRRDRCRFRGLSLGGVPGAREGASPGSAMPTYMTTDVSRHTPTGRFHRVCTFRTRP